MAVMIRLARHGSKKNPQFAIVAINKRGKRDGKFLEKLGNYDPKKKTAAEKIKVNMDGLKAWQSKGAILSETVALLVKEIQ